MKKNNKFIYRKLNDLKAPIDKSQTWNAIYNRDGFPKHEKKRRFIFWYFFVFGILLLLGGLVFSNYYNEKQVAEKGDSRSNVIIKQNQKTTAPINKETDEEVIDNEISKSDGSQNEASPKIISTKNTKNVVSNFGAKLQTDLLKETFGLKRQYNNLSLSKTFQKNSISQVKGLQNVSNFAFNDSEEIADKVSLVNKDEIIIQNLEKARAEKYINRQYQLLPILTLGGLFYLNEDKKYFHKEEPIKIVSSIARKSWAIEIAAGIGAGMHNITEDSLWRDQSFINDNTESIASYMFSLRVSKKIKNNWRLAMGLRYANNRRLFSYTNSITQYARLAMPMPHFYTESTDLTTYTFYRQHQTLDVESLLIRDFNWKRTTVYTGIGVDANAIYNFNGEVINSNREEFDLNTAADYKDNLGWGFLYEIGISQQFKQSYYISASLSGKWRYDLNNRNTHSVAPLYFRLGFGNSF